ncbi:MAG: PilZ domain-containing protein [Vulcanimicrobiaceae bacterium]
MGWFSGRSTNRREHQRSKRAYKAAYTLDGTTWEPAIGVDLSDEGMSVLTQKPLGDKPVNFRATLDTKIVSMRCAAVWHNKVNHNGKAVDCYGLKFVGIASDDWDAIVKFISGGSVQPANKAQEELAAVRMKDDDVARMLPAAFQRRLFEELVKRHRLSPLGQQATPLVQFEYGGVSPWRGKNMHRLTIHSKISDGKAEDRFSTRFMFDENGKDIIVLN